MNRYFVILVDLTTFNVAKYKYTSLVTSGSFLNNISDGISNSDWKSIIANDISESSALKVTDLGESGGKIEISISVDYMNQSIYSKKYVTDSISNLISSELSSINFPFEKTADYDSKDSNKFTESKNDGGWYLRFSIGVKNNSDIYISNGVKVEIITSNNIKKIKGSTPDNNSIFLLKNGKFTNISNDQNESEFSESQTNIDIVNFFVSKMNLSIGSTDTSKKITICDPSYQYCKLVDFINPVESIPSATQSLIQSTPINSTSNNSIVGQDVSKGEIIGNSPANKSSDNIDPNGKFPGITNLDKPTIDIKPIRLKTDSSDEDKKQFARGIGYLPFVWYNGYQIDVGDLRYFALYHDGIIPKIKITFYDTMNIINTVGFPLDDTKVQIFLNSKSKNLKSIHLEFKIQSFQDNGNRSYTFIGTVNLPNLYLKKYKSFNSKTSFETLREVCKDLGVGFNSNIDNSNDRMTWINAGKKCYEFMDDIILNSYKSDESFIIGYIDYYYCFNYVDLEKELSRDISNDLCIDTSGFSEQQGGAEEDRITRMGLSNDLSFKESSMYFENHKLRNDSTSISLRKGYTTKVKYYDDNRKDFLVFDVDSITSEGDKTVILKASPNDETFFKDNYSTVWTGKIDLDNSHLNYNYSVVQNRMNIDDLVKISVDIWIPNSNFNLYKFQKIFISFINQSPTPTTPMVMYRLTGEWLIVDISYLYTQGKMTQVVKAVKRELGMSEEEIKLSPPPTKKEIGEINENPFTAEISSENTDPVSVSNNPTETPLIVPTTDHILDMIPGTYVDNNGNSIQVCAIDGKPVSIHIADKYLTMKDAASNDGIKLKIMSSFRSPYDPINAVSDKGVKVSASSQEQLYNSYLAGTGNLAAPPGQSNHGNGIGVDLNTGSRQAKNNGPLNSKVYTWLVENSWKYGFIRAVASEEWHFDYLPSIAKSGPYAKLNVSKRKRNDARFYSDLGLDSLDDITESA